MMRINLFLRISRLSNSSDPSFVRLLRRIRLTEMKGNSLNHVERTSCIFEPERKGNSKPF